MTIVNSTTNRSNGVVNRTIRYFETNADAAADTDFVFGFTARYVRFINLTDRIVDEWYEGMAADSALETSASGVTTLESSDGITVNTDGSVTIPAALMVASKSFVIVAEG